MERAIEQVANGELDDRNRAKRERQKISEKTGEPELATGVDGAKQSGGELTVEGVRAAAAQLRGSGPRVALRENGRLDCRALGDNEIIAASADGPGAPRDVLIYDDAQPEAGAIPAVLGEYHDQGDLLVLKHVRTTSNVKNSDGSMFEPGGATLKDAEPGVLYSCGTCLTCHVSVFDAKDDPRLRNFDGKLHVCLPVIADAGRRILGPASETGGSDRVKGFPTFRSPQPATAQLGQAKARPRTPAVQERKATKIRCIHGTRKGHNCWRCGGLAGVL
jgi:hypothetical protein